MSKLARIDGLEIGEDFRYQRRQWIVQRVAWAAMAIVAVAALAGLLGNGPLSDTRAGDPGDPLSVAYDRFLHLGSATELKLELSGLRGASDVTVQSSYLDGFRLENVVPEPDSQQVRHGVTVMTFEQPPAELTLTLDPQEIGYQRADVSVAGEDQVTVKQFVYP